MKKSPPTPWLGLAILILPALLISVDLSALDVAIPSLSVDLRPSGTQLLWIMDIYGFLLAGFLMTMGSLGDRIGRRKLLMIGAAVFGLASVAAAFSRTAAALIGSRALMGVAGATLAPTSLALISTLFPDSRQRTKAIAIWGASLSAGGALGPVLGGLLLEHFSWGSIFLLAVPVMTLLLAGAPKLLPESRQPGAAPLNFVSVALALGAILPVIYGIKQMVQDGFQWPLLGSIVAGLILGGVFVYRENRIPHPFLDLTIFRAPAFRLALGINLLGFASVFGVFFFTTQYLQLVLGLSTLAAGLWTAPTFVGFIAGSLVVPYLERRVKAATLTAVGLGMAAIGVVILTQMTAKTGLMELMAGSILFSVGLGQVFTLVTTLSLQSAPPEQAGAVSGITETSTELGGALGIAVLGVLGTAVYRSQIMETLRATAIDAIPAAKDTLGAALASAGQLPNSLGHEVISLAREAFVVGMRAVFWLIAALLFIAMVRVILSRRAN